MNKSRRELMANAAGFATAAALPVAAVAAPPPPTMLPAWILAAEADPVPFVFFMRGMALHVLALASERGGLAPECYDADLQRNFTRLLREGLAVLKVDGRLQITDLGRREAYEPYAAVAGHGADA